MTAAENPDKLHTAAPDPADPLIAAAIAGATF